MAVKKEKRKPVEDIRNELAVAKEKRRLHLEKVAAYDLKYKADAQARRDKPAAQPPAEAKPAEPGQP